MHAKRLDMHYIIYTSSVKLSLRIIYTVLSVKLPGLLTYPVLPVLHCMCAYKSS